MKIKILVSIAGSNFSHIPGEEPEIEDKEAKRWIAAGIAEKVATKRKAAAKPAAEPAEPAEPPPTTPAPKKKATGRKKVAGRKKGNK